MDRTDGAAGVIRNGSTPRRVKGAKKGLDSREALSARLREERRKTRELSRPR